MTLGEFRKQTAKMPDHLDLFMDERLTDTDFKYGLVNSIERKEIEFSEGYGGGPTANVEVIVLSED
jgi:hypothetical protein